MKKCKLGDLALYIGRHYPQVTVEIIGEPRRGVHLQQVGLRCVHWINPDPSAEWMVRVLSGPVLLSDDVDVVCDIVRMADYNLMRINPLSEKELEQERKKGMADAL